MGTIHRVGSTSDLASGESRCVRIGDEAIALFNCDGTYYATDDTCTHEEASLSDGWLDGTEISCPLHGAVFDVTTGAVLCLPAIRPLRTYPVRVEGDDIFVEA